MMSLNQLSPAGPSALSIRAIVRGANDLVGEIEAHHH